MTSSTVPLTQEVGKDYRDALQTLSEGSVNRRFDPYLDIDWDSPELALDPKDPRWVLSPEIDPLGATAWYQSQPLERQIEIGRWRIANSIKVGAAFETILIRGMMQYIMKLPNGSPEFRYCLHEMTEECNHIQMFQELVNRIGVDVPGMRPIFRALSPFIGVAGGYAHVILFIGILGGEEPIDHFQKALIRDGANLPPMVLRTMEIHIAEEARHISFAGEFLKAHIAKMNPVTTQVCAIAFPLAMRWLAGEIIAPPRSFAEKFDIPREVIKEAFWRSPQSRKILSGYFGDMRALADEIGLMNPVTRRLWKALGIDGDYARYRSEPDRRLRHAA
ncbi:AurF N-oxygenase family protein [Nocardia cyriacigeorgica]|uniref:p-aminobenzoate N-oxygenase AurF n=1 Tax=Nocardia cyriacigeorgica TaxID=135487 RepID=A0A4U8W3Y5_9NOCA|nr:diiron oxygenase [Nocardia cyriacigeorgica]MBF6100669.1 diiron oxygenase [Nocardia cyriacigeorgica]MBF6160746.1 diiron oxygenase [Nocardia cyriacigeorgica]MBF6201670.1 diiron oxygenase [Nocardia cyriacigeorgica]MBF6318903.1 diiron oxygenase [Nocardia cyriacigeorgica]MBF6344220.1 diiron oxygenase [Nocardia cyriacigeorgica]